MSHLDHEGAHAAPINATSGDAPAHKPQAFAALLVGAVGVVYGDIGTSPLYAFREALRPLAHDGVMDHEIIGLTSLMIWALTIIVSFKYILFLLKADNDGEGGTLSLLALLLERSSRSGRALIVLGLIGAAMFFGDALITPALSVLSAVEGVKLITPVLEPFIVPLAIGILVALFMVQSRGTAAVAKFFGPITIVWFLTLALAGLSHISDDWSILYAFNPLNAAKFLYHEGVYGLIVLGAVFLTVTGAEALYADLGHFGGKPIRVAWFALVFPALTLNYLGQGAFVLKYPEAMSNPFYLMFPEWALIPAVILATLATIIASQAVITGAFSMTRQAINLGYLPRMTVLNTSEQQAGQIYVPVVNRILLFGVIMLILSFGTSEALSTAYGISVTGAMIITSVLFFIFARRQWGWSLPLTIIVVAPFALLELVFLGANMLKVHDGGYVPILLAVVGIVVMLTWQRGSSILRNKVRRSDVPIASLANMLENGGAHAPTVVSGTAIFLTSDPETAPAALLHNIKHNHVIHERNVILTLSTDNHPRVPEQDRVTVKQISERFIGVELRYGYMENQNVSHSLAVLRRLGYKFDIMTTSFYLSRRKLLLDPKSPMPIWQRKLFITLAENAADPSDYFRLPGNRVVELGAQVSI
jgi:KUP system potassium uptake protein